MLFNSYIFIFAFLPIVFILYFLIARCNVLLSRLFLVLASLFFYSYFKVEYIFVMIFSIIVNYILGSIILNNNAKNALGGGALLASNRAIFIIGILFNVAYLGFFKYCNFFIDNLNLLTDLKIGNLDILLPLAISFFTFQQISFLSDCYTGRFAISSLNAISSTADKFISYCLFVSFFPQLIAGPIVHHSEMMPQFLDKKNLSIDYKNIALGLFIFAIGLFKKVVLADSLAICADAGFSAASGGKSLSMIEAYITSVAYSFQLYFDFSGYCDMAIGIALFFNIKLPINFNSPYKAKNIQDFWRRWHITLGRFLRDYVYIPLGGSRVGYPRELLNLFVVFLIGGLWHGAGYTFIMWGALHGLAMVLHRVYSVLLVRLRLEFSGRFYALLCVIVTFYFVNLSWVFFRSDDISTAISIISSMFGTNEILGFVEIIGNKIAPKESFALFVIATFIIFICKNSISMLHNFKPSIMVAVFVAILFSLCVLNMTVNSSFLYFNF